MIVTFCGHSKFVVSKEYEQILLTFLNDNVGDRRAEMYLGGYGNFDNFALDCCRKYKETHPGISIVFITPYITIEYQQNHLKHKKALYDYILYPEIENKPLKFAISYRNKWMVEKADYIICGIDHAWGGAYKTYLHAKRRKKHIINVTGKEL